MKDNEQQRLQSALDKPALASCLDEVFQVVMMPKEGLHE